MLAVGIIAAILAAMSLAMPLGVVLVTRERVSGAADAAALAGADVVAGLRPGDPCSAATMVAAVNSAGLSGCAVDGLIVTVSVTSPMMGFSVTASATAGPGAHLASSSTRSEPPADTGMVHARL